MEQTEFAAATIVLSQITTDCNKIFKELSDLLKTYKPTMNSDEMNEFYKKRCDILHKLHEKDTEYKNTLLDIIKQIKEGSDEVIKQYCNQIIDNYDYFYAVNYDNREKFIEDINEIVEMYKREIEKLP